MIVGCTLDYYIILCSFVKSNNQGKEIVYNLQKKKLIILMIIKM
jgi:hypothetical protein